MAAMGVAMTHDELLARIKQYSDWAEVAFDTSPTNALRAVVKRHYPFEFHLGDVISEIQCAECNKKYPCNTIIDIEKELK